MKPRSLKQKKKWKSKRALKKFKARKSGLVAAKDAQKVGKELLKLAKGQFNKIEPVMVVDNARDVKSPLHKYFEWDDTAAAEKYRLYQARQLIASIQEVVVIKGEEKEYRAFPHIREVKGGGEGYVPLMVVVEEPIYLVQLIGDVRQEIGRLDDILSILLEYLEKREKKKK